jgi:hypothetical protein
MTPWRTIKAIVIQIKVFTPWMLSRRIPECYFENPHQERSIITATPLGCLVIRDDLKGLTADSISPTPKHLSRHKLVTDLGKIILSSGGHTIGTDIPFSEKIIWL